jgi:hypothetical protein
LLSLSSSSSSLLSLLLLLLLLLLFSLWLLFGSDFGADVSGLTAFGYLNV